MIQLKSGAGRELKNAWRWMQAGLDHMKGDPRRIREGYEQEIEKAIRRNAPSKSRWSIGVDTMRKANNASDSVCASLILKVRAVAGLPRTRWDRKCLASVNQVILFKDDGYIAYFVLVDICGYNCSLVWKKRNRMFSVSMAV
ncbi:hypothetical protein PAHAL_3G098800 [Panicum hallii]|uniref:Uncharacterized protein n=1 Tax=Panicum hallii TaxID=206008 RepID=A0A2S3H7G8_9POAL|nr:hypothetical protein PAHAL_3G098800 [Panicum hallii]